MSAWWMGLMLSSTLLCGSLAGQVPAPSADVQRREALLAELRALSRDEAASIRAAQHPVMTPGSAPSDTAAFRSDQLRAQRIDALLDTLVLGRADGGAFLAVLERAWPESSLFRRYRAALLLRAGRAAEAFAIVDALQRRAPRDLDLARLRGRTMLVLADTAATFRAWSVVLDAVPSDREAFDALLSLHAARGSLAALRSQLHRLRLFESDTVLLASREAEVAGWQQRTGAEP